MTQTSIYSASKMHCISKTPFSKLITPFQKQKNWLQQNTIFVCKQFPRQSHSKVKQLLQQLNSVQMVQDILSQEAPKVNCNIKVSNKKLSTNEENILLKKSFLSLYRKLNKKQKLVKQLEQQNYRLSRQNQFCKSENKYLKQCQQLNYELQNNMDIY